jgi:hypothetical protein
MSILLGALGQRFKNSLKKSINRTTRLINKIKMILVNKMKTQINRMRGMISILNNDDLFYRICTAKTISMKKIIFKNLMRCIYI